MLVLLNDSEVFLEQFCLYSKVTWPHLQFRWSLINILPQRLECDSRKIYMGFMKNKLALIIGSQGVFWFRPAINHKFINITYLFTFHPRDEKLTKRWFQLHEKLSQPIQTLTEKEYWMDYVEKSYVKWQLHVASWMLLPIPLKIVSGQTGFTLLQYFINSVFTSEGNVSTTAKPCWNNH
jgi:hypothetical protein